MLERVSLRQETQRKVGYVVGEGEPLMDVTVDHLNFID